MPIRDPRKEFPASLSQRPSAEQEYIDALMRKIQADAKRAGIVLPPKPESEPR